MIYIITLVLLGLMCFLVAIYTGYTLYSLISAAPFVPTHINDIKKMLEMIELNNQDNLIDLGSGDGRVLFLAAKTGAHCTGVEINPLLYLWSLIISKIKKLSNVNFYCKDLWKIDLKNYNILTIYFIHNKMEKLANKIKLEMKPGSKVISYGFKFENWQPEVISGKIYLYIV